MSTPGQAEAFTWLAVIILFAIAVYIIGLIFCPTITLLLTLVVFLLRRYLK